jgi:hypothetical protein
MEVMMLKAPAGGLVPMDDEFAQSLQRIRTGSVVRCEISEMRNGLFFRKWWSMVKMAYDMAGDRLKPMEYKGHQVLPCFDEFRKDITILAGHFEATYKYDGTVRLKAKSLQWSKMKEEDFNKLYSDTIDVILQKVIPEVDPKDFQHALDMTMSYA